MLRRGGLVVYGLIGEPLNLIFRRIREKYGGGDFACSQVKGRWWENKG